MSSSHIARLAATAGRIGVIVVLLWAPEAFGQATTGAIAGTVIDGATLRVAGAEVTAVELATGWRTSVQSNDQGVYSMPGLKPGVYRLTGAKAAFKTRQVDQVTLGVGQSLTVNLILEVGEVAETVTVSADASPVVQLEESQVANTFKAKVIQELPSNPAGTGLDSIALLAPGVTPSAGGANGNGATFSVNGNRARANNFTIDGGDNNDLTVSGPALFVDNADTVAEYQIITNNFSAEYGRNQGSIVNIITKSGSNEFHGTAAWHHRDSRLDALNPSDKRAGLTEPPYLRYNLASGTLGGPILKDRLFFFGSFLGTKQPKTVVMQGSNPTFAPDQLARLSANNPGNPAIQILAKYSLFALPNIGVGARSDLPQNTSVSINGTAYRVVYPTLTLDNASTSVEPSGRLDFRVNDHHSIWVRELYQRRTTKNGAANASGWVGDSSSASQLTTAGWNWQVSGTAFNEFRFVHNRLDALFGGGCSGINCTPTPDNISSTFPRISIFGITNELGSSLLSIGPSSSQPQGRLVGVYQFADNFTKVVGRHQLKAGFDIRRNTNRVPYLKNSNGVFVFTSADQFVRNAPIQVALAVGDPIITYRETDVYLYAQDNWKLRSSLTLNLGVRWEYSGQPLNTLHDVTTARESDSSQAIWLQSLPIAARTFPTYDADKNNLAPRVGFSWTPPASGRAPLRRLFGSEGQSAFSGGFSISYEPAFYEMMLISSGGAPYTFLNTTINYPGTAAVFPIPAVDLTGAIVQSFAKRAGVVATNAFDPRSLDRTLPASDFHSPYSMQWSVRWLRQFTQSQSIEARYVGTRGFDLFSASNGNPYIRNLVEGFSIGPFQFPGFGTSITNGATPLTCSDACDGRVLQGGQLQLYGNQASSSYHGLQVSYHGRLFRQFDVDAAYTLSKAMDDASEVDPISSNPASANPFNRQGDRSYADFDRRHVLALRFSWDVPGKASGVLGGFVNGWQLAGIWNLASGTRFTPLSLYNAGYVGAGYVDASWDRTFVGYDSVRPFVGNPDAPADQVAINSIDASLLGFPMPAGVTPSKGVFLSMNQLNATKTSAVVGLGQVRYVVNGPGAATYFGNPFGNVPRNSAIGPLLNNWNLAVLKNFTLTARTRLQLRAEAFNAFNHANPGIGAGQGQTVPNPFVEFAGSPDGFADLKAMRLSSRVLQVGAKIIF